MSDTSFRIWYWLCGAAALLALVSLLLFDNPSRTIESQDRECEVEGQVTDRQGRAVTAFTITVRSTSGSVRPRRISVNHADGRFAFTVPPGTFILSCWAEGHPPCEETVTVGGQHHWHPIVLGRATEKPPGE